jgi:PAS domain S-box-containing protein
MPVCELEPLVVPVSEIGQANLELPQADFGGAKTHPAVPSPSLPGIALALIVLLVGIVLIGGMMLHHEVSNVLRVLGENSSRPAPASNDLLTLRQLGRWQLSAILFTTTCGLILIGLAAAGYRRFEEHWERVRQRQSDAWRTVARDLRSQLIDLQKRETGLREQRQELQHQLESMSRCYTEVKEELEPLKLAKEVFTHQRRELVRSNDVLELHVQARTQQLQKLQRAYELILNSAGEGICGLDTEDMVTFANPAAAKMVGLEVHEIVGRPAAKIFPQFVKNATQETGGSGHAAAVEVIASKFNGTKFGAEFLRTPIRGDGRIVGEVLLFKDITERKRASEELAKKAEELARSNAELEQFAFVASHDLQEPLRKIQAFGDRLKSKCDAANLQEGRDYLDRMQNAAARMQTLIYDLLTFSRVISRTEPFVPINLNNVVREIISDLEVCIEKTGARVCVGELPTLEADGTQMRQLLQNVIGNALKFHAPGKAPLVRVESRMLPASTLCAGKPKAEGDVEWCELSVSDNGIGFDEKYLEKIFAVFQRLHGRQEYEGTGIGLAVCRRIADRHSGAITARSKPGEGATFLITLPLRQPAKPGPET